MVNKVYIPCHYSSTKHKTLMLLFFLFVWVSWINNDAAVIEPKLHQVFIIYLIDNSSNRIKSTFLYLRYELYQMCCKKNFPRDWKDDCMIQIRSKSWSMLVCSVYSALLAMISVFSSIYQRSVFFKFNFSIFSHLIHLHSSIVQNYLLICMMKIIFYFLYFVR